MDDKSNKLEKSPRLARPNNSQPRASFFASLLLTLLLLLLGSIIFQYFSLSFELRKLAFFFSLIMMLFTVIVGLKAVFLSKASKEVSRPPSQKTIKPQKPLGNRDAKLKSAIVGLLVRDRTKNNFIIYCALVLSFAIYVASCYFSGMSISTGTLLLLWFLLMGLFINQYSLEYRLRKGFYGANEYEAREIIQLILKHSNKADFSDGNGLKELFPEPELEEDKITGFSPAPGH